MIPSYLEIENTYPNAIYISIILFVRHINLISRDKDKNNNKERCSLQPKYINMSGYVLKWPPGALEVW